MTAPIGFKLTAKGLREADPKVIEVTGWSITVKRLIDEKNIMLFPGTYYVHHINETDMTATFRARTLPGRGDGACYLPERRPRPRPYTEGAGVLSCLS